MSIEGRETNAGMHMNAPLVELIYSGGGYVDVRVTSASGVSRAGRYDLLQACWAPVQATAKTFGCGMLTQQDAAHGRVRIGELFGKLLMGLLP